MGRSPGQTVRVDDRSGYVPAEPDVLGAMAIVCERGPIGEARRVDSWPEFQRLYGNHVSGYIGTRCAQRALEGGCALLISRVVHYADLTDASTKASASASVTVPDRSSTATKGRATGTSTFPVRLTDGQTLVVSVSGGGDQTATFNGYATRLVASGGTYASVTSGHALVLVVNGVQRTVTFTSEGSASDFAATINSGIPGIFADVASGNLRIRTDKQGTGASLTVHSSSAADVLTSLGFTSGQAGASLGTSNVADIDAVTAAEFETIVEDAVTGVAAGVDGDGHPYIETTATGGSVSVQVKSGGTARTAFGFDTTAHSGSAVSSIDSLTFVASSDGAWAHAYRVVVDDAQSDPANRFRVRITKASTGEVLETHDGLSMTSTDPRYVVNVLRDESAYFTATDEASETTAPDNRPAAGTYTPAGGDNGLTSLSDEDYLGAQETRTGLYAFRDMSSFRLVSAPGVTSHAFHVDATAWAAALTEVRYVGTIPYAITTVANAKAFRRRVSPYATGTAINSAYGVLYAGWHRIRDARTREDVWLPAEGEVYAAMGAAAKAGGLWLALAGENRAKLSKDVLELRVKPGIDDLESMRQAGVNPFYFDDLAGFVIEGQTTLQRDASQLDRLNACLLTDVISENIRAAIRPARWEPNDELTWHAMRTKGEAYMRALAAKRGTFETDDRGHAEWRVVCDSTNNSPGERALRRVHYDVYYTPVGAVEEQKIDLVVLPPGATA